MNTTVRNIRRTGAALALTGSVALAAAVLAQPAAAHTPSVTSGCTLAASYVEVHLRDYNGTNTVRVEVDGTAAADTTFAASYDLIVNDLPSDEGHTYRVVVDAHDDPDGSKGWDVDQSGKIPACDAPPKPTDSPTPTVSPSPTTPAPTSSAPSTPAPTTSSPFPTVPPGPSSPSATPTKRPAPTVPLPPRTTATTKRPAPAVPLPGRSTSPAPSPSAVPVGRGQLAETGSGATPAVLGGLLLLGGVVLLGTVRRIGGTR